MQTCTKPLHEGKGKASKSAQPQSWLSKSNYLFFHRNMYLSGGSINLCFPAQEVFCSPASHRIRGAWSVQNTVTLPRVVKESLWVLASPLRLKADTSTWLITGEMGHLLAPPFFFFKKKKDLCPRQLSVRFPPTSFLKTDLKKANYCHFSYYCGFYCIYIKR